MTESIVTKKDEIVRIKTHIDGLDEQMQGGIPQGHITLVAGAAGTMKSSVSFNIIFQEAIENKRNSLYLSLEQSYSSIINHMINMDYDFSKWEKHGNWDLNSGLCPICLLDGDSHSNETKDKLIKLLNGKDIDLLFIDGDHTFDGCKLDFDMYGQLVRPGGIIAIHDTQMHRRPDEPAHIRKCGEFFDILPEPKYEKHIADRNWDGYGIGFIYKI